MRLLCVDPGTANLGICRLRYCKDTRTVDIDSVSTWALDGHRARRSSRIGMVTSELVTHFFMHPPRQLAGILRPHILDAVLVEQPTKGQFMHQLAGGLSVGLGVLTGCMPEYVHPRTVKRYFKLPPGTHDENKASALCLVRDILREGGVSESDLQELTDHEADAILLGLRYLKSRHCILKNFSISFIRE